MNTSKQVNAMIGVLFLSFLLFGAYILHEGTREADAREHLDERNAERGATLFVNNCRTCHGLEGKGSEEGGVAPPLNTPAFRIIGADEAKKQGILPTAQGEADSIKSFLFNTISCGRTGTFMPTWASRFGGPLSDTQVNQLVLLITQGRWDLVNKIGSELDKETGRTRADIIATDPSTLSVTEKNCGQFNSDTAAEFRSRNPFAPPTETPAAGAAASATQAGSPQTATPAAGGGATAGAIDTVLKEFSVTPAQASAAAGSVTFKADNQGVVAHELKVIKTDLAPDALPVAAGKVDESKVQIVAKSKEVAAKKSEDVSATLQPGKYVLICNVPGHYQGGMHTAFTVQ